MRAVLFPGEPFDSHGRVRAHALTAAEHPIVRPARNGDVLMADAADGALPSYGFPGPSNLTLAYLSSPLAIPAALSTLLPYPCYTLSPCHPCYTLSPYHPCYTLSPCHPCYTLSPYHPCYTLSPYHFSHALSP